MMASAPMFDPYGNQRQTEDRPRNWLVTCLIGCLVIVVMAVVIAGVTIYWLSQNWRGLTSDALTAIIGGAIDATELPDQEKQDIKAQVDRLARAFRDETISDEQMARIGQEIMESPLVTTIVVSTVDRAYFEKSGLSDEDQAEGKKTLQRFLRGTIDGTIDRDSMDATLAHVADRQPDGSWQLRNRVTDEQLRAFLAAAKTKADEADIPEEPPVFDPSDEVKRIIDEALNEPIDAQEPAELTEPVEGNQPAEIDEPAELGEPADQP
jgi:hypothetical protein